MNFTPESNPQIRALARQTSQRIKALSDAHKTEIASIYQDFRSQADAIKAEASAKDLSRPGADSSQPTQANESIGV